MKRRTLLTLLIVLCFPISIFAEVMILKSGKVIRGPIVGHTDKYWKISFNGILLTVPHGEFMILDSEFEDEATRIAREKRLNSASPKTEEQYLHDADFHIIEGNYPQVVFNLTKAIEINPNNAVAYDGRAFAYYFIKEYDKAWSDVHKAEALKFYVFPEFLESLKKASGRDK